MAKMPASLLAHFKAKKRSPKKIVLRKKGKKPIVANAGGLHKSLGISGDKPIPMRSMMAALAGKKGPLAKKQALLKKNVLTGPKKGKKKRGKK